MSCATHTHRRARAVKILRLRKCVCRCRCRCFFFRSFFCIAVVLCATHEGDDAFIDSFHTFIWNHDRDAFNATIKKTNYTVSTLSPIHSTSPSFLSPPSPRFLVVLFSFGLVWFVRLLSSFVLTFFQFSK